jgi:hypothetical protein
MSEDIEPLSAELWFDRIGMIARGELGPTEYALRHAFHLHQLTPREFRTPEYGTLDEPAYEALLEAGDLEMAARRLLAAPTLTVSTQPRSDGVEATIKCSTLHKLVSGTGNTTAAAILQAWTNYLSELKEEFEMSRLSDVMKG